MAVRADQSALEAVYISTPNSLIDQSALEVVYGLGVLCNNPPAGRVAVAYTHTFLAGAGDPPYSFSIVGAPDGLTLNSVTGVLSGTPVLAGTFTPTVTVTDSISTVASVVCSILITSQIIPPAGGAGGFRPSSCGCSPQVLAAERLRRIYVRRRSWPYGYVFPAPLAVPVEQVATVAIPGVGSTALVLAYSVPEGFRFIMQALLLDVTAGAFAPGDALWTVDLNTPVGVPNVQAMPVQGLTAVPVPLGSVAGGSTWPLVRPYEFGPLSLVQSKATNVGLGAGVFTSGFFGYLVRHVPE
jgi:hypothetical protein